MTNNEPAFPMIVYLNLAYAEANRHIEELHKIQTTTDKTIFLSEAVGRADKIVDRIIAEAQRIQNENKD